MGLRVSGEPREADAARDVDDHGSPEDLSSNGETRADADRSDTFVS